MDAAESKQAFVAILLGKESDAEVMQHTIDVLIDLKIPYEIVHIRDILDERIRSAWLEDARHRGLGGIVVGAYYAYTDELFPSVLEALVPVWRVTTGPEPLTLEQLACTTIATTGTGPAGATNAGLLAARVLAGSDPALSARLRGLPSQ